MKTGLLLEGNGRIQHLAKRGKNGMEFCVVALLQFVDFAAQIFVGGNHKSVVGGKHA